MANIDSYKLEHGHFFVWIAEANLTISIFVFSLSDVSKIFMMREVNTNEFEKTH